MKCLSCTATLGRAEYQDIQVDNCPQCGGIWLEEGELELLLGSAEATRHYLHSFDPGFQSKDNPRKCPLCKKVMENVLIGKGVPADKCVNDHGLWCNGSDLQDMLRVADAGNPKVLKLLQGLFAGKKSTPKRGN